MSDRPFQRGSAPMLMARRPFSSDASADASECLNRSRALLKRPPFPSRNRRRRHQRFGGPRDRDGILRQHPRPPCQAGRAQVHPGDGERRGEWVTKSSFGCWQACAWNVLAGCKQGHRESCAGRRVFDRAAPAIAAVIAPCSLAQEVAEGIMFTWSDSDIDPDSKERVAARFPYGA